MPFEEYKKRFYQVMKDDVTWQSLTEKQKHKLVEYTYENEEIVADLVEMIMKEKELN